MYQLVILTSFMLVLGLLVRELLGLKDYIQETYSYEAKYRAYKFMVNEYVNHKDEDWYSNWLFNNIIKLYKEINK